MLRFYYPGATFPRRKGEPNWNPEQIAFYVGCSDTVSVTLLLGSLNISKLIPRESGKGVQQWSPNRRRTPFLG
jgi:hypothetical protein